MHIEFFGEPLCLVDKITPFAEVVVDLLQARNIAIGISYDVRYSYWRILEDPCPTGRFPPL